MQEWHIYMAELGTNVGHEQTKKRPCIVIKSINSSMNMYIEIPLTSNQDALRFPYTLNIDKTNPNGLINNSVALIFQIRSISGVRLEMKPIGILSKEVTEKIKEVIRLMLNL